MLSKYTRCPLVPNTNNSWRKGDVWLHFQKVLGIAPRILPIFSLNMLSPACMKVFELKMCPKELLETMNNFWLTISMDSHELSWRQNTRFSWDKIMQNKTNYPYSHSFCVFLLNLQQFSTGPDTIVFFNKVNKWIDEIVWSLSWINQILFIS